MTTSTILTLFVVPAVYAYMDRFGAFFTGRDRKEKVPVDTVEV
jgi:hypothetical protein